VLQPGESGSGRALRVGDSACSSDANYVSHSALDKLLDRVGDRHRDEHCPRRSDPGDQRERRRDQREDRERRQSQQPRPLDVAERPRWNKPWASRNRVGPPNARMTKPSVASSPVSAAATPVASAR
jgi:hypothetical protein